MQRFTPNHSLYPLLALNSHLCKPIPVHASPFPFPCKPILIPMHVPLTSTHFHSHPSYPFLSLNSHPCKPILSMTAIPTSHSRPSSKPPHFIIFPLPMCEYTHSIPILHATHTLFSLMHARTMHPWLPSTPTDKRESFDSP